MISFSEITEQKITEKYNGLSQDLKDVLSSADTSAIIENIAVKYQLDEEKIEMLIQLAGLVILGFATFEDMKTEMKENLEINLQFIPSIADEIHQKIFLPIANSLQKTITAPATPAPATVPQPVAPPREPAIGPEVVDLRRSPPVVDKVEPLPPPPPPPLIEAEPHKASTPPLIAAPERDEPRPSGREAEPHKTPTPIPVPESLSRMPQIILRSPGLPPTDLPRDILDLRKDKGEF